MLNRRKFIITTGLGAIGISTLNGFYGCRKRESNELPTLIGNLPRSTPEMQGVDSSGLLKFLDEADKSGIEFHSLMVIRNGHVVAEGWWDPYKPSYKHTLYSLSKSFTSSAIGLAVQEKRLSVEDSVVSFFPDAEINNPDPLLSELKVKHLLTMSVGHDGDTYQLMKKSESGGWENVFLNQAFKHNPGEVFFYNSGATFMLSAIIQKLTGDSLLAYLRPRLFEPLEISGMDWETNPDGICKGATGLRVKTEDIAKLGLLYLQNGKWNAKQILSEDWVKAASSKQIHSGSQDPNDPQDNDWSQGYGYQFWRNRPGGFRADGAFGQYSMVLPNKNAVIAITEESFDMQKTMNLVWDHLLPAMKDGGELEGAVKVQSNLNLKLQDLSITPKIISRSSPITNTICAAYWNLEPNEMGAMKVSFSFSEKECRFELEDEYGHHTINCGLESWNSDNRKTQAQSLFPFTGKTDAISNISAFATWRNDNQLEMTWRLVETAHHDLITCKFNESEIELSFMNSVSKNRPNEPDYRKPIIGKLV